MKTTSITRSPRLLLLNQQTPIAAKLSDHNIVIHDGILSFNMMMQGKWNDDKKRYNNAFGLIESPADYQNRLTLIAKVLAEIVQFNPNIYALGLVEAPVLAEDIAVFIKECRAYSSLQRFTASMQIENFTPWGVATLFDTQRFAVTYIKQDEALITKSLKDRVQKFKLIDKSKSTGEFYVYNLHLPYDLAKSTNNRDLIAFSKRLFVADDNMPVVVMGDFNIDPHIIIKNQSELAAYIPAQNNLLSNSDKQGKITSYSRDTVDGIIRTNCLLNGLCQDFADITTRPTLGYGNFYRETALFSQDKYVCLYINLLGLLLQMTRQNQQQQKITIANYAKTRQLRLCFTDKLASKKPKDGEDLRVVADRAKTLLGRAMVL